jgi:hypothetical protein
MGHACYSECVGSLLKVTRCSVNSVFGVTRLIHFIVSIFQEALASRAYLTIGHYITTPFTCALSFCNNATTSAVSIPQLNSLIFYMPTYLLTPWP